ncbi:DNA primase large subunit-like [Diprion similis]|uniref:DNA primase large subunit-like n=1 Tax=Diprion similis TaxID=362088 RepID=UPI001EF9760E|nr:DNA primase large subunit-like [Diprion similis]
MDYVRRISRIKPEVSSLKETYPHDLQLYCTPPSGDISLAEFQELALERLKVLRIVESVYVQTEIEPDKRLSTVLSELRDDNSLSYYIKLLQGTGCSTHSESDLKARRKDHISHFILQLAYCSSDELKKWFISREIELFKLRYSSLNSEGLQQFLKISNMNFVPISQNEKEAIKEYLTQSTFGYSDTYIEVHDFYKVSFCKVTDLVRNRRVYVHSGFAYIPDKELISVFVTILRMQLASALAYTKRGMPILNTDDRLFTLLNSLHNTYTGDDFTISDGAAVPIESLDALSKSSYPLCMRFMHDALRAKHHLKHDGRQQYGLFLKGIGVLYDDAVRFWREEFCQKMEPEKFEKNHLYNIKHNYGKAGKRTNYTPYGCLKIIQSNVGPEQIHGCAFKETDIKILKQKMLSYGLNSTAIHNIVGYVESGHYQIACGKYFEAVHKCPPPHAVVHPNVYFRDSQSVLTNGNSSIGTGQSMNGEKNEGKQTKPDPVMDDADDMDIVLSTAIL